MNAIGGYFEIEEEGIGIFPHKDAILLNTGRNALEYILSALGSIKKIYLPYYTCEVVLEPINKLKIPFQYYHIDQNFEIADSITLDDDEYIIVNNYFGIKDAYIAKIADFFKDQIIVDCAQAFFAPIISNTKMFYSMRKFVGVPDGGVAYGIICDKLKEYSIDDSSDRLNHLYLRKEKGPEAGFKVYQENEGKLDNQDIKQMSKFTKEKLANIDYQSIINKRRENFCYMHSLLKYTNVLQIPEITSFASPLVYPYMPENRDDLRTKLIGNRIYVAKYWPNVKPLSTFELEVNFADNIIPIPIDQRYNKDILNELVTYII